MCVLVQKTNMGDNRQLELFINSVICAETNQKKLGEILDGEVCIVEPTNQHGGKITFVMLSLFKL